MRINVYSQELTSEVLALSKKSNTGIEYTAVQFVLHSSPMLHHPPKDDDRSAVTFWLPQSERGLKEFHAALCKAYTIVSTELARVQIAAVETPAIPTDWQLCEQRPMHSIASYHRGRWVDGELRCWDCPATWRPTGGTGKTE